MVLFAAPRFLRVFWYLTVPGRNSKIRSTERDAYWRIRLLLGRAALGEVLGVLALVADLVELGAALHLAALLRRRLLLSIHRRVLVDGLHGFGMGRELPDSGLFSTKETIFAVHSENRWFLGPKNWILKLW